MPIVKDYDYYAEATDSQRAVRHAKRISELEADLAERNIDIIGADAVTDMAALRAEVGRLQQWVNDLQAGMYINCVYCGHRYGPDDEVEATMQQALYDHIKVCPKHPLSEALADNASLRATVRELRGEIELALDCPVKPICLECIARLRAALAHEPDLNITPTYEQQVREFDAFCAETMPEPDSAGGEADYDEPRDPLEPTYPPRTKPDDMITRAAAPAPPAPTAEETTDGN